MTKNKLPRHVLAAYYNDARLNIRDCLNDIRVKRGLQEIKDDGQIKTCFKDLALINATPEDQKFLIKQLRNRFRFLDPLTDAYKPKGSAKPVLATPAKYSELLDWMFTLVNDLRNAMTHAIEKDFNLSENQHEDLFHAFTTIYPAALKEVKNRLQIEVPDILLHDTKGNIKILDRFDLAPCTYWKDNKYRNNRPLAEVVHDFGHVLFCSLFLDKTQSAELVNHFWEAGYGNHIAAEKKKIVRELVGVYRVRPPLRKLHSDLDKESVTMDAITNLSRCPRILLDSLDKEKRDKFRFTPLTDDDSDTSNPDSSLHDRVQNRFVELLLHFFDFNTDNKLRFAIDLGQLFYNVRAKPGSKFEDGCPRVRRLSRKLIGYGRLSDFDAELLQDNARLTREEKRRKDEKPPGELSTTDKFNKHEEYHSRKPDPWKELEENYYSSVSEAENALREAEKSNKIQHMSPYIVPCFPHYHLFPDKIGFRLATNQDNSVENPYPTPLVDSEKGDGTEKPISSKDMEPEFWISPRHLVSMAFYIHLQEQLTAGEEQKKKYPPIHILLGKYKVGMIKLYGHLQESISKPDKPDILKKFQNNPQVKLDDFFGIREEKPFSVKLSDLPRVISRTLDQSAGKPNDGTVSVKDLCGRANYLIEETEQKLSRLKDMVKLMKKRGKKGFRPIKCGHIADFLTDDLLRFQQINPEKPDGGKLNSQEYQILQASLAYYSVHIDKPPKIEALFNKAHLLGQEYPHLFLHKLKSAGNYPGLLHFYEDYLKERKAFIESYRDKIKKGNSKQEPPKWMRLRQNSTLAKWLCEQKHYKYDHKTKDTPSPTFSKNDHIKPLPIPRNFFYTPILEMVAKASGTTSEDLKKKGTQCFVRNGKEVQLRPAVSWLIKHYLAECCDADSIQEMYEYPRNHVLFDVFLDTRDMGSTQKYRPRKTDWHNEEKRKKTIKEIHKTIHSSCGTILAQNADRNNKKLIKKQKLCKLLKLYKHRERVIRNMAVEDIILYLFAKEHLQELQLSATNHGRPNWKLKTIRNTVFNTPISYRLSVPDTDKFLYHKQFKLKNLGEFRLQVRDRRLPGLLAYYPEDEKEFHIMEIRAELQSYRRERVKVMKLVRELEREIGKLCPDQIIRKRNEMEKEKPVDHYILLDLFKDYYESKALKCPGLAHYKDYFTETQRYKMRLIRNGFCHNQYPDCSETNPRTGNSFQSIVNDVRAEKPPENPEKYHHRKVAERLSADLATHYEQWFACIKILKGEIEQ